MYFLRIFQNVQSWCLVIVCMWHILSKSISVFIKIRLTSSRKHLKIFIWLPLLLLAMIGEMNVAINQTIFKPIIYLAFIWRSNKLWCLQYAWYNITTTNDRKLNKIYYIDDLYLIALLAFHATSVENFTHKARLKITQKRHTTSL